MPPRAYGGVEAVIADLVDALLARGHDVTLLGAAANTAARFIRLWDKPFHSCLASRCLRSPTRPGSAAQSSRSHAPKGWRLSMSTRLLGH
ncbi:glycosyl transferase, group 1 family domain protein [Mycobacterium xenopi 3993]|nr:glycosyl transferase, group 1 family domain protein [Mycobacterium xenopi 3993]